MTITAAESVAAGTAPAHCRVAAVLTPSTDSHIEMEAWLPESGWNGKFQAVGNGGWAGSISFDAMAAALREGYATASTDTGHKSAVTPGASFALDHPEKLIDFGYRAVHETDREPRRRSSRRTTARRRNLPTGIVAPTADVQGLMEAQRYPDDFDGIVAGAPAANWTGRALASLWVAQAVHKDEASYIPPAKYPLLHHAVLEACDALDGVRDGILGDPQRCKFDPEVLRCAGADSPSCLTAPQVEAARKIYTVRDFYPGLAPGSELGWATYGGPRPFAIGNDYGRFVLAGNPNWDFHELDVASRGRARREGGQRNDQRAQSGSAPLPGARRKADSVPRVERSADSPDAQRELLQQRTECGRTGKQGAGFLPPVHGAGHGSIAEAVRGPISSTRWRRWSAGARRVSRQTRSWRRT